MKFIDWSLQRFDTSPYLYTEIATFEDIRAVVQKIYDFLTIDLGYRIDFKDMWNKGKELNVCYVDYNQFVCGKVVITVNNDTYYYTFINENDWAHHRVDPTPLYHNRNGQYINTYEKLKNTMGNEFVGSHSSIDIATLLWVFKCVLEKKDI